MIIGKKAGMNKKGELTSTQLILLILVIAGFVIILLFIATVNVGFSDKEAACKLSVLTRATTSSSVQGIVPLQCTTKKICLSDGKGKCEESFLGEKYDVINLPKDQKDAARVIEEQSAKAMYDCWSMMGQGKLDLFGSFTGNIGFNVNKPVCIICSRLAIDSKVSNDTIDIVNVQEYMRNTKVPGSSLTYLQSFTDRGVSSYSKIEEDVFKKEVSSSEKVVLENDRQIAFVFSQIKTEEILKTLGNLGIVAGGAVIGGAYFIPGFKQVLGVISVKGAILGVAVAGTYATYNAWRGQTLAAGYCGEFTSNAAAKKGCSLVEAVPYTVKNVNALCPQIEGSP